MTTALGRYRRHGAVLAAVVLPPIIAATPAVAAGGADHLVSVTADGRSGNDDSDITEISGNGRYVVYVSTATNLVRDDRNGRGDVFVRDLATGVTELVSRSSGGVQGNQASTGPSISADGRFVAFSSWATNLVPGDTNRAQDVFVRDRTNGRTSRVSLTDWDTQVMGPGYKPAISANGRFVAFDASGSLTRDANGFGIYVRDLVAGSTTLVSVASNGQQLTGNLSAKAISGNGRFVAWATTAANVTPGDDNEISDVFIRDLAERRTEAVSVDPAERPVGGGILHTGVDRPTSISFDGRYVAFNSFSDALVPDDTNEAVDVFVRDRLQRTTSRVSVSDAEQQLDAVGALHAANSAPDMSADGRYVSFYSRADNVVADSKGDGAFQVYVRDRQAGTTRRVSNASAGGPGNESSNDSSIADGGTRVAFTSFATDLTKGDTNNQRDIYVWK